MCDICGRTVCHFRCPNAPDPPTVYRCDHCGDPIFDGDEIYSLDGNHYHTECFEETAVEILIEEYGAKKGEAEADYGYEGF